MKDRQHSMHHQQTEHKDHLSHEKNLTEQQKDQQKYTCPMHPQIVQDKAGNCPIC